MARLAHLALWAKLGKNNYPISYHPLLFHLLDVAGDVRAIGPGFPIDMPTQHVGDFVESGLPGIRVTCLVSSAH